MDDKFSILARVIGATVGRVARELKAPPEGHEFYGNQYSQSGTSNRASFSKNKTENISIAEQYARKNGIGISKTGAIKIPKDIPVMYNNSTGEISINERADFWKDPQKYAEENYKNGWLSSDNPYHVIDHEIGHSIYDPPENWNGGKDIALSVSKYAGTNPREFVSEVYAGMKAGKKYGDDVMRIYKQYGKLRKS